MASQEQDLAVNPQDSVVNLYPSGDMTVAFNGTTPAAKQRFTVSSTILAQASQFFRAMLRGNMREAAVLAQGEHLTITLAHDDADAMAIILRILHHAVQPTPELNYNLLARVAIASDKYDLLHISRPWLAYWLIDQKARGDKEEIDYCSLIYLALRVRPHHEQELIVKSLCSLPPRCFTEWQHDESIVTYIPQALQDTFSYTLVSNNLKAMTIMMNHVEQLRDDSTHSTSNFKTCMQCRAEFPVAQLICALCNGVGLITPCNVHTRTSWFFRTSNRMGLKLRGCLRLPLVTIVIRAQLMRRDFVHSCSANDNCSLRICVINISDALYELMESVEGINMAPFASTMTTTNP